MTKVGDELEIGGVKCRVADTGPLWGFVKDEKTGEEREQVIGRFVHVRRISEGETTCKPK